MALKYYAFPPSITILITPQSHPHYFVSFFILIFICAIYRLETSLPNPSSREKQYKDRLAAWHVRKNIKAEEVHIMIRKQKKRAARGKQTAFRRSGQEVDQKRIARFVRRYGSSWSSKRDKDAELQSPEPRSSISNIITHIYI